MKTPLRYLLVLSLSGFVFQNVNAQCTASDILIQNIVTASTQPSPTSCAATFDLSFTMENNNGNKFIFLHAWKEGPTTYPNFFDCSNGNPGPGTTRPVPIQSDLAGAFLNIGIDNSGATPVLLTSYPPDAGVTLNSVAGISRTILPDGSAFFVLTGVTATFPAPCNTPFLMALDFWSSQAAQAQTAQCVSCHVLYAINYLSRGAAFLNCNGTYSAILNNLSGSSLSGYYLAYADVNGDGHLSTSVDVLVVDTTHFTIAGASTTVGGTISTAYVNSDLIIVATITGGAANGSSVVILVPTPGCAPLPVTLKSFTASRISKSNVSLRWETSTEINNSGFAIMRNMGGGVWEIVAFVPSQAADGNSGSPLTYTFTDLNSSKGITQYRIRQVDIDGRAKYSEIRAVRGFEQKAKLIVYPNPSRDGRVNVVFDDAEGTRDISLMDISGRMIKQWKAVTGNTLEIENLGQGMYSLRVVVRETGEQSIEKIVVNNR
jgi:hypothetical protein